MQIWLGPLAPWQWNPGLPPCLLPCSSPPPPIPRHRALSLPSIPRSYNPVQAVPWIRNSFSLSDPEWGILVAKRNSINALTAERIWLWSWINLHLNPATATSWVCDNGQVLILVPKKLHSVLENYFLISYYVPCAKCWASGVSKAGLLSRRER